MAGAANHQEASPRRIQQSQRRSGNAESAHYGASARDVQRRSWKTGTHRAPVFFAAGFHQQNKPIAVRQLVVFLGRLCRLDLSRI